MVPELLDGDACWVSVRILDGEVMEEISADSADVFKIDFDVYYLLTSTEYIANVIFGGMARKH